MVSTCIQVEATTLVGIQMSREFLWQHYGCQNWYRSRSAHGRSHLPEFESNIDYGHMSMTRAEALNPCQSSWRRAVV